MKITRSIDGKSVEIELTEQEIRAAYLHQQHQYDKQDVIDNYDPDLYQMPEDYTEEQVWKLIEDDDFVECAALDYREALRGEVGLWYDILQRSIAKVVREWVKKEKTIE